MEYLLGYFLFINTVGYSFMAIDKNRAKQGKWRIPEKRLWTIAIIGGSLGLLIGMRKLRHKTKHKLFIYGIPFWLIINFIGYTVLLYGIY